MDFRQAASKLRNSWRIFPACSRDTILHMRLVIAFIALSLCAVGQSLSATASPSTVSVGKPSTLSLTYTAGSDPAAAVQWSTGLPTGGAITWTIAAGATAAGKQLSCTTAGTTCLLFGLNVTPLTNGVVATGVYTSTTKGQNTVGVNGALGADAAGVSITMSGSGAGVFESSPFDLNGDGLVNSADLLLAAQQALGIAPCGTADFNGDGKCNIIDLALLAVDSLSANP